jgi:hypothetical protein
MNSDNIVSQNRESDMLRIIENMKICLKDLRETYYYDGDHPYRYRYLCYAIDNIINDIYLVIIGN